MVENNKIGLGSFRKNRTERPTSFNPEKSAKAKRTMPDDTILEHSEKRLSSKELPKSIRLPLDTHSAISTLASIQNKKIYEVVTDIVEDYVKDLPPQSKKLVRNNVEAIKNSKV